MRPMNYTVLSLKIPKALPMDDFLLRWSKLAEEKQALMWNASVASANSRLQACKRRTGFAILGQPTMALMRDCKYSLGWADRIAAGEALALAALASELLVTSICEVKLST